MPAGYKVTVDEYVKRLKIMGVTLRPLEFNGMQYEAKHQCSNCGNVKAVKPNHVLKCTGTGCFECSRRGQMHDASSVKYQLKALSRGKVKLVGEYNGAKTASTFTSSVCGHTWEQRFQSVVRSLETGSNGCPLCSHDNAAYKRTEYKLGRRRFRIQGFEHYGIEYILENGGDASDILVSTSEGKPTVKYSFEGATSVYFPDFYYAKKNRIVEVKSIYTLGLTRPEVFRRNVAKAKACLSQGYEFSMLVFTRGGKRIALPKNWMRMPPAKLRVALSKYERA